MNIVPAPSGHWSLVISIIAGGKRWRLSEWIAAAASERPEQVTVEAFPIIAWSVEERVANGKNVAPAVTPVHENPRAELADLREVPGGSIRLRSGTVLPNRAALVKLLLGDAQTAWDAAHPVVDANGTDNTEQK